jgi:hypothetical protein
MASDGFAKSYAVSGETTEWEDILIKKGITSKEEVLLSKGLNPEDFVEKKEPAKIEVTREDLLPYATLDELEELEEDEYSDSRALEQYRQKRLEQFKQQQLRNRFGEVVEIVKDDWIREVTEASNTCFVFVHLYHDALIECNLLDEAMAVLAPKFKAVKFLKIKSTQAIENWPERNLPTIFVYNAGVLKFQLMTINALGGKSMTAADLEWWLATQNVVETELDENPRKAGSPGKSSFTRVGVFGSKMTGLDSDDEVGSDEDK